MDGTQIRSQTLARFHVTGLTRTGRPGKVTVRRHGSTLLIAWTPASVLLTKKIRRRGP